MRPRSVSAVGRHRLAARADLAAALALTTVLVGVTAGLGAHGGGRAPDALGYAAVILSGAALAGLRRFPRGVFAVAVAAVSVYIARDMSYGPVLLTPLIALLGVSLCADWRSSAAAAAVLCAALAAAGLIAGRGLVLSVVFVGWSGAAVLIGDVVRRHNAQIAALRERALVLERTREEELRRRIAEDRLAIARDLHDSVAHAMEVINVQAAGAARVIDEQPDRAKDALSSIRTASRDVLEELSSMLTVLREPTGVPARAPIPGLADVPVLIEEMHGNGLDVSVMSRGPLDRVPPSIGTAAYRIVQESLTNILRHASARKASIEIVAAGSGALSLTIVDDGAPAESGPSTATGSGVGLQGMRERARASGGQLVAGRTAEGGFRVHADWEAAR
jgi:signal transduction histidine kinase